jgi:tetratricopeptide (TPR) repeat protein
MNTPRFSRSSAILALLAAAGTMLSGCGGHGQYTKEGISEAQERMSLMKSGTEWEQARQQFFAGDLEKALKTVDKSITINDQVAKAHLLRGRILLEQGQLEKSRQALTRAEELEPENVEAQYYLGLVHERVNEPDEAYQRYHKAMKLDTSNAQYPIAAAEMLIQLERLDEAESLLREVSTSMQYSSAIRQTLGHIELLRGQPARATSLFQEALRLAPDDASVLEDLVRAQIGAEQFAEAEFNITRLLALKDNENRRDLLHLRSRCLLEVDRPVEAREVLLGLTSSDEGNRDLTAWIELGNVCCLIADRANLRTAAQRVTALAPSQPDGYMFRAMLYRMEGDNAKALSSVQHAVQRAGNHPAPLVLKGLILQDLGRLADAQQAAGEALAMSPSDDAANKLSQALQRASTITTHPSAGE